ncbi:MAG: hypothetical protein KF892_24160 [Rhizobacter sp.]|nr:hypothetical protein [Rhizobacter sp.]
MFNRLRFNRLFSKSVALGNQQIVMPIDLFDLAQKFSDLPGQEEVVAKLISTMFSHESMQVRRIALHACLRSKRYAVTGLQEAIAARLGDSSFWVRYDAAWLVEDSKITSPEIVTGLRKMASSMSKDEAESRQLANPSDYEASAAKQAYKALTAIGNEA